MVTPPQPAQQLLACNGLPGKQKPGLGLNIVVTATAIEGLVGILETPLAALAILPIVAGKAYYLQNFCGEPQPADPVLTDQDFRNALDVGDIVASGLAAVRINQWLDFMLWPLMCDCADGTSAPPVGNTSLPGVGINPGLPAGDLGPSCWNVNGTGDFNGQQGSGYAHLLPQTTDMPNQAGSPESPQAISLPHPTSITFTASVQTDPAGAAHASNEILFWSAAQVFLPAESYVGPPYAAGSAGDTHNIVVPADAAYWSVLIAPNGNFTANLKSQAHIEIFCGGNTPTTTQTPCCPPDPSMDVRLRRIEQLEQVIIKLLGHALVGHVDGTRHSNLSGSGSVVLVDSVDAIRVEVTSDPTGFPVNPGTPNYWFSLGFITSIAEGSPLKGWRLVYLSQTYPIVSYADSIGYTLTPGVHVDIVELLPSAA